MTAPPTAPTDESHAASRPAFPPAVIAAAIFTACYMAAAAVGAVAKGNLEFLFYAGTMVLLIGALLWAHWRVRFSAGLIWLMAGWGALHMAGGLVPVPDGWAQGLGPNVLYSLWLVPVGVEDGWLKFDNVVHAFGFGAMTWLCWQALQGAVQPRLGRQLAPSLGLMTLCVTAAMGFGALNEIIEFIATRLTDTNVGGYLNTSLDLLANAIGAIIAALLIALTSQRPARTG